MSSLRSALSDLAAHFASSILATLRNAKLDDILAETGGSPPARRGPGRPRLTGATTPATPKAAAKPAKKSKPGRLARRSPADIAKALSAVVALVKKNPKGLRAEQIRAALRMEAKEMPRVLKEGLAKKALKSKGEKRSTTYTTA